MVVDYRETFSRCELPDDSRSSESPHIDRLAITQAIKALVPGYFTDEVFTQVITGAEEDLLVRMQDMGSELNHQQEGLFYIILSIEELTQRLIRVIKLREAEGRSASARKVENFINALGKLIAAIDDLEDGSRTQSFIERILIDSELEPGKDDLSGTDADRIDKDWMDAGDAAWRKLDRLADDAREIGRIVAARDPAPLKQKGRKNASAELSYISSLIDLIHACFGHRVVVGHSTSSRFNAFTQALLVLAGVWLSKEEIQRKIKIAKERRA